MGVQLGCLWIFWTGCKAELLAFRRSKRCRRSRIWCTSACCTPGSVRSANQLNTAGIEYAIGQVLLSTSNLRLKLPRKLNDQYMGPLEVFKRVEPIAYKLGLSYSSAWKMIHPVFHVSLLRDNGLR